MGESVSTESQPPKLCSWILFPNGSQVKGKSPGKFFRRNLLWQGNLRALRLSRTFPQVPQNRRFRPVDFGLSKTKSGGYVIGRAAFQRRNVIIASASSPFLP